MPRRLLRRALGVERDQARDDLGRQSAATPTVGGGDAHRDRRALGTIRAARAPPLLQPVRGAAASRPIASTTL
jgi:hypothetical protein